MTTSTMRPDHTRGHCIAAATTVLIVACLFASRAPADPADPPPIVASGDQLYGSGSTWFPIIPQQAWLSFEARLPANAVYVDGGLPVGTITASVIDPAATGVTLPRGRNPDVLFVLSGNGIEIDQPLRMTWPNIDGYAPGEIHLVYAYDPRIDQWRVCGAAVVSADGAVLEQYNFTENVTLSYYFLGKHALVTQ